MCCVVQSFTLNLLTGTAAQEKQMLQKKSHSGVMGFQQGYQRYLGERGTPPVLDMWIFKLVWTFVSPAPRLGWPTTTVWPRSFSCLVTPWLIRGTDENYTQEFPTSWLILLTAILHNLVWLVFPSKNGQESHIWSHNLTLTSFDFFLFPKLFSILLDKVSFSFMLAS